MKTKLLFLAIGSALLLIGCYERSQEVAPGPSTETSYSYVYYPDAEVYYEPHRHVYFWADGGAWRSGPSVPPNIVLSSHVTVDLKSAEPYQHHEEVRAKHPRHTDEKERGH